MQATSVEFNADGNSSLPALLSGTTYSWAVAVEDANGNRARREKAYTVP